MSHDVIVIGGSAGSIEVLLGLVGNLPTSLPASIFITVHTREAQPSALPELLSRRGPLPASHPLHGEKIVPGRIYVAPPDNHLLVRPGTMAVVRGPRENGHRPAVDALFRSASSAYASRVVGVVLSGYLDCGTAGLMSIKARGGLGVAQSPDTAVAPDMPRSAISAVPLDYIVTPLELPALLTRLATSLEGPALPIDHTIRALEGEELGAPSGLVCPACQGVLSETKQNVFHYFRCHVGHAFSLSSLLVEQNEEVERALWAAVRALEESAALARRLSHIEHGELGPRFSEKAATQAEQADLLRQILLHGLPASATPPT